jgi:hypothetical protein
MYQTGSHTAKKVEDEISNMAEFVLDIVSEDIEEPHVPDDVKESAMQEHGGKKREDLLNRCKLRCNFRVGVSSRNNSEEEESLFQTRALKELPQKYQYVNYDDKGIDYWEIF